MTTYAIGHLRNVTMGPDIIEYLRRIDATLAPLMGSSSSMAARSTCWKDHGRAT